MIHPDEVRHLESGPNQGEVPGGSGLAVLTVHAEADIAGVLQRAKEALIAALGPEGEAWNTSKAGERLPDWFHARCGPEQTQDRLETWLTWWRSLPVDEQAKASTDRPWTVADWLYWIDPNERAWHWWNSSPVNDRIALVSVQVDGWPTALGALEWVLKAAGASAVEQHNP